jgi:ABC-type amino acid transport substrate-binding protein
MGHALVVFVVIMLSAFTAVAQPLEGRLKIVRDTATLRLAYRTDSRPFSFLDAQGQPSGFTIELCERIGKSIERELALPSLAIKWVPVDARSRFETIIEGSADMECGSTFGFSVAHEGRRLFKHNLRRQHRSCCEDRCGHH